MPRRLLGKTCGRCDTAFECGPDHEHGRCWCDRYPPILPPTPGLECLCPRCLTEALRPHIAAYIAAVPKPARKNNPAFTTHARPGALVEGLDFVKDSRGYMVFTEWYHLKRGDCCGNGCRHCPY